MTGNYQLISVTNFDEPRPKQLADPGKRILKQTPTLNWLFNSGLPPGISEPPHCWTVILPQYTLSRHVEVLIATAATIIVVDGQDAVDQVRVTRNFPMSMWIIIYIYRFFFNPALTRAIHKDGSLA
jgi:hypothetical protein